MKAYLIPLSFLSALSMPVQAKEIDLGCHDLAAGMVERLSAAGLLVESENNQERALAIAVDVCSGAESKAQDQHEEGKREAMKNWLTTPTGGKSGNDRLKSFKR